MRKLIINNYIFLALSLSFIAPYVNYLNFYNVINYGDLLLLIISLPIFFLKRKISFRWSLFLPLLFFSLSILSLVYNLLFYRFDFDFFDSFKWLYFQFFIFIFYYLLYNLNYKDEFYFNAILSGLLLSILLSWLSWYKSPVYLLSVPMLHQLNDGDFLVNRNYVGFFTSLGVSLSFVLYQINLKKLDNSFLTKSIYFFIFCIFLISSLFSFSKGTWLVSILSVLLLYFYINGFNLKLPLFLLVFIFLLSFLYPDFFNELYYKIYERINSSSSTNDERFLLISEGFSIVDKHFLIGTGPGSYLSVTNFYNLTRTTDPHNTIIWIFVELGVLGLISVLFVFIVPFLSVLSNINNTRKILILSLSLPIILNIPFHGLPIVNKYIWFLYAFCFLHISKRSF